MAPKKGSKKAAGSAKTIRTIARSAKMEAKLSQLKDLKKKFAGVAKALRPALVELAERTSQQLNHPTYYEDGPRKAQYEALVVELEKVRSSNVAHQLAFHKASQEMKAVSVQHETLQEMTTIEAKYRKQVEEIRDRHLTHLEFEAGEGNAGMA